MGRAGVMVWKRMVLLVVSALLTLTARGEIYRWVDGDGKVHFGDRPPPRASESVPLPDSAPPRLSVDERRRREERRRAQRRLLEVYREERRAAEAARDEAQRQEAERERRCAAARQRLADYERAQGLYDTLPDGSRRYLSRAERRAETEKARQAVAHWCDGGD